MMETTITPNQLFEIAVNDLRRLSAKLEIDTKPKSKDYSMAWESSDIYLGGTWETFKDGYAIAEISLKQWLDSQHWLDGQCWLHAPVTSDYWLNLKMENSRLRMCVYKKA